ncbi:SusC/RagA family TonB-linked outer membrane protein [Echinicola sp. CAU 1574]|uniref:SusC/RagA family TonB-linked outer membrane protein n=1 Tax=Echinicola arenosa TaxID=2774144 RepID=A0ABR9ATR1_9BACT|nr:SusC/RagA family TonB-linked outer membrane protein [Echinicola arenosa]MBD8491285.1 SusC/RagA family TonB-linked outer membrane protein [Echinicola arenosa]
MKTKLLKKIVTVGKYAFFGMIIQCFFLSSLLAGESKGQTSLEEVYISLSKEKVSIEDIFAVIESETEFHFSYRKGDVKKKRLHSSIDQKRDVSVGTVLRKISIDANLQFKRINNVIYVGQKDVNSVLRVTEMMVPDVTIKGNVKDESGMAIPGVTVTVQGSTKGTVTDIDGNYTITVPEDGALTFSFIGYSTQTIALGGQSVIDVVMVEDAKALEEFVVVGYGKQKKVNLTGAITAVETDNLTQIPANNLSNTLAGRAPGVNVTGTSGLSGATSSIRIRGSFGDPLYVIDGIVRDKESFDALEAMEVEQISFLKDAATASIYGSRAGNGVVLVTTKQGSVQKPMFNFQTSYAHYSPTMELLSDKTTATDELIYQNRVAEFNGTTPPNGEEEFAYFSDRSYNVNDFIWQNPWSQNYSLSVTGGNDKLTYYSLMSYRGEEGSYKSLEHGKFNLRTNVTAKISERIKLGLNLAATQQNHDRFYWPFSGDDDYDVSDLYRVTFNWPKVYPFYLEEDGTPANYVTDFPVQTPMGSWQAWSVIDQIVGDRYIKTRKRQMNSILSLDIDLGDLIPGLSTKVVGNYLAQDYMRKKYLTFQENYVYNQADPDGNRFIPAPPDPNNTNIFTFSQNQEFLSYDINTAWSYQFDWFLNYNQNFDQHGINAMMVFEQAENGLYGSFVRAEDPVTNYDQDFVYSTDAERRYGNGYENIGARQSLIGRVNYNYAEKYIAEFSFRYDGNTLFPKESRWGFFPSFSAAWRIVDESFMSNARSWLDDFKIRVSYGTTGNDLDVNNNRISPFSYNYTYSNSGSYIFGDDLYRSIAPGATPNPNLTWATSTTYNTGIDFELMETRLSGSLDVFYKKEEDILGSRLVTLPDNYGQDLAPENYAERSWRGGELSLMWRDVAAGGAVNYSVYGNLGYAKDQWDVLDQAPIFLEGGNRASESQIGQAANRIFGLRALGIIRTQEQLDELLEAGFTQYGRDPYLGGLYFEDIRGDGYSDGPDGRIDGNDFQLLSNNASPRINYGFGFNLDWNNFSVNAHFQGVGMYDRIISNQEGAGMRQHGGAIRPYYPLWADDVWTPDNPDAKYPRPIGNNWYESGTGSTSFWIRNGAYLRLKNLNLAYNLPKNWLSSLNVSSTQVFFNGTNLFSISDMKEFHDPEQKNYDSFPLMKSLTVGLNVKF